MVRCELASRSRNVKRSRAGPAPSRSRTGTSRRQPSTRGLAAPRSPRRSSPRAGIRVVSTGGIGGVHPGNGEDVSSDLTELSRQPVCVVCAGPKSTLNAGATLERLETLGVPVIGWRSSLLAGFLATSAGLRLSIRVEAVDELASILARHWELGGAGVVISQPPSGDLAIPAAELAADEATTARGPDRTPAELSRLQARLGDRVIRANVALLERNAALAAGVAQALRNHG